jgi:hypothetical protein
MMAFVDLGARRRRFAYGSGSTLVFVQNLANALVKETGAECNDSILRIRVTQELERDPSRLNLGKAAREMVKDWHRANNRTINQTGNGPFVPGVFIMVTTAASVPMRLMRLSHLQSWQEHDEKIVADFNRQMGRKQKFRLERMKDFAEHPDLLTLLDIERELYGYVSPASVDMPFSPHAEDDD